MVHQHGRRFIVLVFGVNMSIKFCHFGLKNCSSFAIAIEACKVSQPVPRITIVHKMTFINKCPFSPNHKNWFRQHTKNRHPSKCKTHGHETWPNNQPKLQNPRSSGTYPTFEKRTLDLAFVNSVFLGDDMNGFALGLSLHEHFIT